MTRTSTLLKAYHLHGRDCRCAVSEACDGGITILTSSRSGRGEPAVAGVMLTFEERLALTRYLLENPPVVQPLALM